MDGIRGVMGACLTPFDDRGGVDHAALERQLEFMVPDVCAISVAAVEASEYGVLSTTERHDLLRHATEVLDGRVRVVLGASHPSVRGTLELAELAAGLGGDVVSVLMPARPWAGQPSPDDLVTWFTQVAERSPLPLLLYHNPGTGADPGVRTLRRLAELPNVSLFKESSRDVTKILRMVEAVDRAGLARYFTTMQPLLTTLVHGGSGATMPPPATRIAARVVRAYDEGDLGEALRWQRVFTEFPARWGRHGLAPVMKAAMRAFGVDVGLPAAPFAPLPADEESAMVAHLAPVLEELGV